MLRVGGKTTDQDIHSSCTCSTSTYSLKACHNQSPDKCGSAVASNMQADLVAGLNSVKEVRLRISAALQPALLATCPDPVPAQDRPNFTAREATLWWLTRGLAVHTGLCGLELWVSLLTRI